MPTDKRSGTGTTLNLRRGLQILVLFLVAYYIGQHLQKNYEEILHYPWGESLRFDYLFLAFVFLLAHFALVGVLLAYLLCSLGLKTRTDEGIRVAIVSSFGKYIPGKLWASAGKVYMLRRHSSPILVSYVVAVEIILALAAGAVLCIPIIVIYLSPVAPGWALLALSALTVPAVVCRTDWFVPVLRRAGVAFPTVGLSPHRVWIAFAGYVLSWSLFGAGFWCLVNAVYPLPVRFYPHALGSMSSGWIVGFIVLVSPGGLGVREGVLLGLTKTWLPLEIATVVSLGARLWTTAGEILALGLIYVLPLFRNSRNTKQ